MESQISTYWISIKVWKCQFSWWDYVQFFIRQFQPVFQVAETFCAHFNIICYYQLIDCDYFNIDRYSILLLDFNSLETYGMTIFTSFFAICVSFLVRHPCRSFDQFAIRLYMFLLLLFLGFFIYKISFIRWCVIFLCMLWILLFPHYDWRFRDLQKLGTTITFIP